MQHFLSEMDKLKKKLLGLSTIVEESVLKSVKSLQTRSRELAETVIERDHEIDLKEVEVEEDCLKMMALYQPVAIDLRFLVSTLKINNDLERIGDLAVNIAERAKYLSQEDDLETTFNFDIMAEKTHHMLRQALDSLIKMDSSLACSVCALDDEVDRLNADMYDVVYTEIKKNPSLVEQLMHYLFVSRHLERIADYATNIAEDVIYMVEGSIPRHKPEEFKKMRRDT